MNVFKQFEFPNTARVVQKNRNLMSQYHKNQGKDMKVRNTAFRKQYKDFTDELE